MTDDPRDILKAAGVECAKVEEYAAHPRWVRTPHGELTIDKDQADAAILALARLVAEAAPLDWIVTRTSRDGAQAVAAHFADYGDADRYCKTMNRSRIGRGDRFTFRGRLDYDA